MSQRQINVTSPDSEIKTQHLDFLAVPKTKLLVAQSHCTLYLFFIQIIQLLSIIRLFDGFNGEYIIFDLQDRSISEIESSFSEHFLPGDPSELTAAGQLNLDLGLDLGLDQEDDGDLGHDQDDECDQVGLEDEDGCDTPCNKPQVH